VAGAIDFNREPQTLTEAFDLVLDLGAKPASRCMRRRKATLPCLRRPGLGPACWPRWSSCATWWVSSRSPSFLPTNKSSARTAATRPWAAMPASTSARPRRQQREKAPADRRQSQPVRRLRRLHHGVPDGRAHLRLPARQRAGRAHQDPAVGVCKGRRHAPVLLFHSQEQRPAGRRGPGPRRALQKTVQACRPTSSRRRCGTRPAWAWTSGSAPSPSAPSQVAVLVTAKKRRLP
jgi:hypothetical protein